MSHDRRSRYELIPKIYNVLSVGVAVGRYYLCGPDETTQGEWTAIDVLQDKLHRLNVPILGGLALGHGENTESVPLGTMATLDVDAGTLTVEAAVR